MLKKFIKGKTGKLSLVLAVVLVAVISINSITAKAADYVTSSNCPHGGDPEEIGYRDVLPAEVRETTGTWMEISRKTLHIQVTT